MTINYSTDIAGGGYFSSVTGTYYKTMAGAQQAEAKAGGGGGSYTEPFATSTPKPYTPPPPAITTTTTPAPPPAPKATPLTEAQQAKVREADFTAQSQEVKPSNQRAEELNSQNTKWVVNGVTYDTYAEAEAAAKPKSQTPASEAAIRFPVLEALGITPPTIGAGTAVIKEAAQSIVTFGNDLSNAAAKAKLEGNNVAAGALASATIAVGVADAVIDAATLPVRIDEWGAVIDAAKNPLAIPGKIAAAYEVNPLFTAGYIAGDLALMAKGASDLYQSIKGVPKDPLAELVKPENNPRVATEWPEGSPEYNAAMMTKENPTAFSMIEPELFDPTMDTDLIAPAQIIAPTLELDAPLIKFPAVTVPDAMASLGVVGLGASGITGLSSPNPTVEELRQQSHAIAELSTVLNEPDVVAAISKLGTTTITDTTTNTITDNIPDVKTINDQTPIQEQPPIEITEQIPDTITEQLPTPEEPTPEEVPPPEEPGLGLPNDKDVIEAKLKAEKRNTSHTHAQFHVVIKYRRGSDNKTIQSTGFVAAYNSVVDTSRHPIEAEVTRL